MLQIKNLTYKIKQQIILNNITLSFPDNKITCIIGPNGCGKSTLLAHMSGLLKSRGEITLDNICIKTIPARIYARRVAILSQREEVSIDEFRVKDIVLMGRYPHKKRFHNYSAKDLLTAEKMMFLTGLHQLSEKKIKTLSGGERQRVFIARALTQEPEILLLDEPTNHLDVKYKFALMEELKILGKTIIIVLHDLSLAARYCDNAVVMYDGSIAAAGATGKILTPEFLEKIFEVPFYTTKQDNNYFLYY